MKWKMEAEIPQKSRAYMRWKKNRNQFFKQSRACMRLIEMGSNFLHFIQAWIVKKLLHFWKKWGLISSISYELGLLKNLKVQF
jgi:hypothetical protein